MCFYLIHKVLVVSSIL